MVAEGGGVRKAWVRTAWPVTLVGLDSLVRALVGSHVGAVCKALATASLAAHVRLLASVDANVRQQVGASLELLGLLLHHSATHTVTHTLKVSPLCTLVDGAVQVRKEPTYTM